MTEPIDFTPVQDKHLRLSEFAAQFTHAGEENIGWSLGHLVAHVTASSEENAALASLLARGIAYPREPRLRYETPWQQIATKAAAVQRLEESRRMRLGYLATFPDRPFLQVLRDSSERFIELFGEQNAIAVFLFGLYTINFARS